MCGDIRTSGGTNCRDVLILDSGRKPVLLMFSDYGKIELSWIVPALNRQRYYCVNVERGLFGPVLVRSWGRMGWERMRIKEHFFSEGKLADALVEANRLLSVKLKKGYDIIK